MVRTYFHLYGVSAMSVESGTYPFLNLRYNILIFHFHLVKISPGPLAQLAFIPYIGQERYL